MTGLCHLARLSGGFSAEGQSPRHLSSGQGASCKEERIHFPALPGYLKDLVLGGCSAEGPSSPQLQDEGACFPLAVHQREDSGSSSCLHFLAPVPLKASKGVATFLGIIPLSPFCSSGSLI